jgi:hypothetical protein
VFDVAEDREDEDAQYPTARGVRGKTAGVPSVTIW